MALGFRRSLNWPFVLLPLGLNSRSTVASGKIFVYKVSNIHLSPDWLGRDMNDLSAARSHSSMNIENLTSIPVGGSNILVNYAHRQPPTVYSPSTDRGWAWVVCAGSFFVMFMVYGIHTSFGVLLVVLLDHFNASKASTGKQIFIFFFASLFVRVKYKSCTQKIIINKIKI